MLPLRLLRLCSNRIGQFQAKRMIKPNIAHIGLGVLKSSNQDNEISSLYPTFERLGVATQGKVHKFSVECDQVVKFIKLGAINKNIGLQYCHYLVDLAKGASGEDKQYYESKCLDLFSYLLRSFKDMPFNAKCQLLSHTSSMNVGSCKLIYDRYLDDELISKLPLNDGKILMASFYKFQLWKEAESLLNQNRSALVNIFTIMSCMDAVIDAASQVKTMGGEEKELFKRVVVKHLMSLLKRCQEHRIHIVSKRRANLIDALQELGIKPKVNPTIKLSGRCTGCDTKLPLFDGRTTKTINEAILRQILEVTGSKEIYLNVAPNDIRRFLKFLDDIFRIDNKPIDCVIDGLNVSYKNSLGYKFITQTYDDDTQKTHRKQNPEMQARVLINILIRGNFLKDFKKILVVGKHHMEKWPGLMDFFKQHNIHYYSSFNNSKDDLIQLYASTLNPKTVLVTNDFLRDHLVKMDTTERKMMERWIDTHQVWINSKNLKPIWPTPHEKVPSVDEESGCFHMPIIDGNMIDFIGTEPPPHLNSKMMMWACCQLSNEGQQQAIDEIN